MRILLFFCSVFLSLAAFSSAQESYIVVERYSKRVLLASGTESKRPVGSLAHMVTANVALDWKRMSGASSSTVLTVPPHTFYTSDVNPLNLQAGDQISFRDALYATILSNDAVSAQAIAHHVGSDLLRRRQIQGSGVDLFIAEMNNLARSIGMTRTRFSSPTGADLWKRNSYSTATDMAKLAVSLSTNSAYGFYAKQKQRTLKVRRVDGREAQLVVINSNKLLGTTLKVDGLKAAYSQQAGQCYSITADHDAYRETLPDGNQRVTPIQLVVVVMGSADANGYCKSLIKQGWQQYENWRRSGYMASPDRREFLKMSSPAQ